MRNLRYSKLILAETWRLSADAALAFRFLPRVREKPGEPRLPSVPQLTQKQCRATQERPFAAIALPTPDRLFDRY